MNVEECPSRGRLLGIAGLLAALTFVLYVRVASFEFLNYDDPDYVTGNPVVAQGLSLQGARWAFGFHAANWHPLTWLSHMLDVQLFGQDAGAHHLVNAGLHALAAALLLCALAALTGALWPSVLVAALFAFHPVRVQSVAWVAERKELLAAVFFFAALWAYARHARRSDRMAYGLVLLLLVLGCMAKPMLVTAPFVLLLLDVWPLQRSGARVWLEKLPFLAVAAASAVLTLQAQRAGGAVGELASLSIADRIWSAAAGYLAYLRVSVWPAGLAAFYPHPLVLGESVLVPGAIGAAVVVAASMGAWLSRRCCPAVFTGWFWFAGMLVPVIGLVQVGDQAWADRYAYLPTIGLALALVFGLAQALEARPADAAGLALAGFTAAGVLGFVSARTLPHWQDSRALFERALAVTDRNWIAHNNLGLVYLERREIGRAEQHFRAAAEIHARFVQARYNLGLCQEANGDFAAAVQTYRDLLASRPGHPETTVRLAALARADGQADMAVELFEQAIRTSGANAALWAAFARLLLEQGDVDRAANCATSALKLDRTLVEAHLVLGEVLIKRHELDEAGRSLRRAVELDPQSAPAHALLGRWHLASSDLDGARAELRRSIELDPGSARARHDLGALLMNLGEIDAAREQFKAVDDIHPGDPEALIGLGAIAMSEEKPREAIELFRRALERLPGFPVALTNLAAAYEATGEWRQAIECYQEVLGTGVPDPEAACAAAWILATGPDESVLDGEKAVQLATYAAQRQVASAIEVLAAAYARVGDFERAVQYQQQAIARARSPEQKRQLEERLRLFEAGQPYTRPR